MSTIHVVTLIEALDRPSTMKALTRKTGYDVELVLRTISEARAAGHSIQARSRGQYAETEPSYYELEVPNGGSEDARSEAG